MYTLSPAAERRLLWLLALTQFTVIMDFMVMMPLGPQIMRAFAIGPAAFATAVSTYSWCSGLSGLLAATYIDRFDRRRLLLVIYALFALSNLVCAWAPSFAMLLVARAFAGITGGVLSSLVMAIMADLIPAARRGAATGILMTSFSLAAVAGVPAGVVLGAAFGWSAPFLLLVVLSGLVWLGAWRLVPPLREHLAVAQPRLAEVLPALWSVLGKPRHLQAYGLTFVMMGSQMLVIPFIAPVLVANYGVPPGQLGWMYMAGGAATFFSSRAAGRLADRFGNRRVFRVLTVLSFAPLLLITHLPHLPFLAILACFPFFMVLVSSRVVPLQNLLSMVPEARQRGAFLSASSAVQAFGTGCGAWIGGLLLSTGSDGQLHGYGSDGWLAVLLAGLCCLWIGRLHGAGEPRAQEAASHPAAGDSVPSDGMAALAAKGGVSLQAE